MPVPQVLPRHSGGERAINRRDPKKPPPWRGSMSQENTYLADSKSCICPRDYFSTIGQLAPFQREPLSDNLRRCRNHAFQDGIFCCEYRVVLTIGQLAPFRVKLSDNLRRFYPQVSDNLRRLQSRPIGQLAPKLSDNLRRSPPSIGQLAPKKGLNYRTTCAKLSDNLRRFTRKMPCSTRLARALVVDNIYYSFKRFKQKEKQQTHRGNGQWPTRESNASTNSTSPG